MLRGPSGFCPQFTAEHSGIVRAGKLNDSDLDHKDRGANCTTGPLKFFYLTELFGPVAVVTKPQAQRPLFRGLAQSWIRISEGPAVIAADQAASAGRTRRMISAPCSRSIIVKNNLRASRGGSERIPSGWPNRISYWRFIVSTAGEAVDRLARSRSCRRPSGCRPVSDRSGCAPARAEQGVPT